MRQNLTDTIAAIATPVGEGAIAIVRLSGQNAISIGTKCFAGKVDLKNVSSHTAHFGKILNADHHVVDEVIALVFKAPNSYSGEDTIEFNCHGGVQVTKRVLECLLATGARLADPGEFTKRAFLNGKMDLSQAEAVADLIQSQSQKAHDMSLRQLDGVLSTKILEMREQLVGALGLLELELDFVEEDVEFVDKAKFTAHIKNVIIEIENLLSTYKKGKMWREGVQVALVGPPNAGKSSLLNALLNEERSIVSHVPGTTRDFIEEKITIEGLLFRIIDTAGLRHTEDSIEKEGVRRTRKIIEDSDIVVLVHDCTVPFSEDEKALMEKKTGLLALNKVDLNPEINIGQFTRPNWTLFATSALKRNGLNKLRNGLASSFNDPLLPYASETFVISNQRHFLALERTGQHVKSALISLEEKKSNEFIAVDIRSAIDAIGEIVGFVTSEEMLNSVFSKFCIGK